jgi:hypothetical protein
MNKSKAQLNWEVGREAQERFIKLLFSEGTMPNNETLKQFVEGLFIQIRQNEYRRGKEDTLKEVDEKIKELKESISRNSDSYVDNMKVLKTEYLQRIINEIFGKGLCE